MGYSIVALTLALSACGFHVGASADAPPQDAHDGGDDDAMMDAGFTGGRLTYLKASNTETDDRLGTTGVALSADGRTLAVGAPNEDSMVGLGQADNSASNSGAVYVYSFDGTAWSQQAFLKASNSEIGDQFGYYGVALSGDGNTLAVSAYLEDSAATGVNGNQSDNSANGSGAVYVFTRAGATWTQQAYLKASNPDATDQFGLALALSSTGDTLAVGSFGEDSAATGINGNQADNTALDSGAVYVFTRSGTSWAQQAYIKASNTGAGDLFGGRLALAANGNTLAVRARLEDSAATGINGNQNDESAPDSGAAYVFLRTGTTWTQQAYLKASNTNSGDEFGAYGVSLSADGNTLAIGAHSEDSKATGIGGDQTDNTSIDSGAVYVFARSNGNWMQQAYVKASNTDASDRFGYAVALSDDGNTLAAAAYGEDSAAMGIGGNQADNSVIDSGAVYVFGRTGTAWMQVAYVKASNPDLGDTFGVGIALSGNGSVLAVGASMEDSAATGINGNQADNSALQAGAVYVFQ